MQTSGSTDFAGKARALRPFYFVAVVWGRRYTDFFLNFCIPSLLAAGNIPALLNSDAGNKFLVVTTREDWQRMEASPIFAALRLHIEPVLIAIELPSPDASVYDHMTLGHRLATQAAFRDKAYGVLLAPDLMLSDGSVAAIQQRAAEGAEVVLAAALRYDEEALFVRFKSAGIVEAGSKLGDAGKTLAISGRDMARVAVHAFHSETQRFQWDAPYFTPYFTGLPGAAWWRVAGEDGVVLHTFSWSPLLVDYGALASHDHSTMEYWVIDGDYVYRNFGAEGRFHVVQDSDEVMLVSWTLTNAGALSMRPKLLLSLSVIGEFFKRCLLRDAFFGPVSDPLKRRIFMLPVHFHADELGAAAAEAERLAQAAIRASVVDVRGGMLLWLMRIVGTCYRLYALMLGRWQHRQHIFAMAGKALRGDTEARSYLRRRTRLYFRQLVGKSVGGEER